MTVAEFLKEVNAELASCQTFIFMARGIEFQKEACESLLKLNERILGVKEFAKQENDEPLANHMFFLHCVVGAFYNFCDMWVRLKSDQMDEAWDSLITAQQALKAALAANDDSTLQPFNERLHQAEDLLFPPQIFTSIGLKVKSAKCSLCECEYGACEHFKGRVYMGEICSMIISESEMDHGSIVETPEDKRCRMTEFSFDGVQRDVMTWRPAEDQSGGEPRFKAIIAKGR